MNSNTDPRNNPLLREVERVSPATSLTLVTGYDEDGRAVDTIFRVGDLVVNMRRDTFRIMGFTLDNLVVCKPYGLDADPAVVTVLYDVERAGLRHVPSADEFTSHVNGLVIFAG